MKLGMNIMLLQSLPPPYILISYLQLYQHARSANSELGNQDESFNVGLYIFIIIIIIMGHEVA
jgi:hypothetical protein